MATLATTHVYLLYTSQQSHNSNIVIRLTFQSPNGGIISAGALYLIKKSKCESNKYCFSKFTKCLQKRLNCSFLLIRQLVTSLVKSNELGFNDLGLGIMRDVYFQHFI